MASSLKFGTSGLRGLASELSGAEARRYTAAFLSHLASSGQGGGDRVFLARDFRASSTAISEDCAAAIRAAGLIAVDSGTLPTPALALQALAHKAPAIMVTGSHIPEDRNGLKFYAPGGEITKADEAGILAALGDAADGVAGKTVDGYPAAGDLYRRRCLALLPTGTLSGWRIGVFEHSTVARDILCTVLTRAGAEVVRLGRSETFVAVDTEAFGDAVFAPRHGWIAEHKLDAIVSSDGDGDRPLLIDAKGNFLRGDAIGLLTAQFLGADVVVTPVTSNSAIETTGDFLSVVRTRVGSPHVIAGMDEAAKGDVETVVGFEANGGVLLGSDAKVGDRVLTRLPTRDAVLPILAVFARAVEAGLGLAELVSTLGMRPAMADRLADVSTEKAQSFAARLAAEPSYAQSFFSGIGEITDTSVVDGPRITIEGEDVIHYRPSGNAPELRCYVEAATPERARMLLRWGLDAAAKVVRS